jgi:hypothetical protein
MLTIHRLFAFSFCLALCLVQLRESRAAEPSGKPVSFEIFTSGRLSAQAPKQWFDLFTKLGIKGLQIRGGKPTDKPSIEEVKIGNNVVSYKVKAELNERGELVVPGAKFTSRDSDAIKNWMANLSGHGAEGVTEKKLSFGLTAKQLDEVQSALRIPVRHATKGKKPLDVLKAIVADGKLPFVIDPAAEKAIVADDPVRDEMQGLSTGTAIASLVRPAGVVLVPRKPANKTVEIWLTESRNSTNSWPIGWTTDERLDKQAPKMLDSIPAEIDGVTAAEAIDAVVQRVELPVLYDYNSMALKDVDLKKIVKIPSGRYAHFKLLRDLLYQVKCNYEVRVDENNKAFLWIGVK